MAAPEEIGLVESPFGFRLWSRDEDDSESGAIRYVRADLLATLEAKLAEVTKERDEARAEVARYWTSADIKPWCDLAEGKGLGHFGKKLKGMFSRAMKAEDDARSECDRADAAEARATALEERVKGLGRALEQSLHALNATERLAAIQHAGDPREDVADRLHRIVDDFLDVRRAALTGGKDG